jgi:hypothetical protein
VADRGASGQELEVDHDVRKRSGGVGLLRARRRPVTASVGFDPHGFVHIELLNNGSPVTSAVIDVVVPGEPGPGWLARVDQEGQPMFEDGSFTLEDGRLHWHETGLELGTGRTLLRFFVGVVEEPDELPVDFRLTAPGLAVAYAGSAARSPLT